MTLKLHELPKFSQIDGALKGLVKQEIPIASIPTDQAISLANRLSSWGNSYIFSGTGKFGFHVDEPEDLSKLQSLSALNIHSVTAGFITVAACFTAPGYYTTEPGHCRKPSLGHNPNITEDFIMGRGVNEHVMNPDVYTGVLQAGETVAFIERTDFSADGPANVLHMFYRGSSDRVSLVQRYQIEDL